MAHAPPETPRTNAVAKRRDTSSENASEYRWVYEVSADFARSLELQLNEARALLTRISDGAEPVLISEEIEEFLDKTELP